MGIAFAAVLVSLYGVAWLHAPAGSQALAVGMATVVVPLCIRQPMVGAGFAGRRTPTPFKSGLRSLAVHVVFGCGLYGSARFLSASAT